MISLLASARSVFRRIKAAFTKRSHPSRMDSLWEWWTGGGKTTSGTCVTPDTAMQVVGVYACVRIIAQTIATLPLAPYRRLKPRGKEIDRDHPLYRVLHVQANPWMSAVTFRAAIVAQTVLRGNGYAEILRDKGGRVSQLWPLRPDWVEPVNLDGELWYKLTVPGQPVRYLPASEVLHLRDMTLDGVTALKPVELAREAIGLAMAAEQNAGSYFGNGSRPGGILTHPQTLTPEARANIKASWEEVHAGITNAHRVAVLEEGLKWEKAGENPRDSQLVEVRAWQLEEMARLFGVPLHLVQSGRNTSYSSLEQDSLNFVVHCIRPRLVAIEAEMTRSLLRETEWETHFVEHNLDGLMRGAFENRVNGYDKLRNMGVMSADDIREKENMNPLPDGRGQDYWAPMNMQAVPKGGLAEAAAAIAAAAAKRKPVAGEPLRPGEDDAPKQAEPGT